MRALACVSIGPRLGILCRACSQDGSSYRTFGLTNMTWRFSGSCGKCFIQHALVHAFWKPLCSVFFLHRTPCVGPERCLAVGHASKVPRPNCQHHDPGSPNWLCDGLHRYTFSDRASRQLAGLSMCFISKPASCRGTAPLAITAPANSVI